MKRCSVCLFKQCACGRKEYTEFDTEALKEYTADSPAWEKMKGTKA